MSASRPALSSEPTVIATPQLPPAHAWPGEWESLASRATGPTTFVSRAWTAAWLKAYAPEAPTRAIEVRSGDTLIGALWLYEYEDSNCGRRWLNAGSGNSDHLDPLLDARHAESAARAMLDELVRTSESAPVELQQISATSVLARVAAGDARCAIAAQDPCFFVDLAGIECTDQLLKKGMRYDLRRSRKMLEDHGGFVECAVPETATGLIDALIELHTTRWHARGAPGVLADAATCALHRTLVQSMPREELVLRALRVDDVRVACIYGFRSNGVEMCYLSGFDPEWSWLQPGKLLLADAIDRAITQRVHRFDMLRGREEYKYRWPVREESCIGIRIGSNDEKAGRTLDHRRCQ